MRSGRTISRVLKGPQGSKLIRSTIGTDKSIPWQCDRSGDSVANAERCREVNGVTVENELRLRMVKEREILREIVASR